MKSILKYAAFILLIGVLFHLSCKKEYSCENCKGNQPPIANAGPDHVITLPTDSVSLDGSLSSDPDGSISGYLWTKISGPASFIITNASGVKTGIKNLAAGSYQFELKVTDNGGLSAKDTMRVTVDSVLTTNHPPFANAGADQIITLPVDTITLNGAASFDPDNNITNYVWSKISGPSSFNILNANAVQTPVTNLTQGVYQFELKITDAGGLFSKDTMQVTVSVVAANNLPPIAKAGNDTTIQSNQTSCTPIAITITLNGSSSYDPDGTIVNYLWTGPGVIANAHTASTTVSGIIPVVNSFILKVTDNNGASSNDTIQITIVPANRPLVPAQLTLFGTLSTARSGMAVAAAGNKIVFAGGDDWGLSSFGMSSARVDIYDVVTHNWSTAELSAARDGIGVAVSGNKIFFAAGNNTDGTAFNVNYSNVDIYDATSDSWSVDSLSGPRQYAVGAAVGDKVFFAGGLDSYALSVLNVTEIYNLTTNSWSAATLSEARFNMSAVTVNNKIYFAGGVNWANSSPISNRIDIYDNATSAWSTSSLIEPKLLMASIAFAGKIYWAGGNTNNGFSSQVEIKNVNTQTSVVACLFQPNASFDAVIKDNKIVFFTGEGIVKNKFDIYDVTTNTWSIGLLPVNIYGASIIAVNNTIYVAGGYVNGVLSNQVWKLEF